LINDELPCLASRPKVKSKLVPARPLRTCGGRTRYVEKFPIHFMANMRLKHMNHTHGYEYDSQQVLGSGALGAPNAKRERRKSRRQKSHEHENEMAQMNERPPNSRRHSSKGKSRTLERIISNEPEIGPVERDRSRSQRRRDPDRDMETGSNPEHSRRLREVRGSRRNRNIDPP